MTRLRLMALFTVAGALLQPGCKKHAVPVDSMALIPREASILFDLNVDRMRGSKVWASIADLCNDPSNKKKCQEFTESSGFNPLTQLHEVMVGIASDVETSKEVAIVIKGTFNEQKLVSYVKDQSKKEGGTGDVKAEPYAGKTLYADNKGEMYFSVLDPVTLVLGGKNWIRKVVDLSQGKGDSIKKNDAVQSLVKRAKTTHAVWGGGLVPPGKVQSHGGDIKSIVLDIDFQTGLAGDILAETPSPDQAKRLADDTQQYLTQLAQMPLLAPVMSGVKANVEGGSMRLVLAFSQPQADELLNRLKGLAMMGMMPGLGGAAEGAEAPPGAQPGAGGEQEEPAPPAQEAPAPKGKRAAKPVKNQEDKTDRSESPVRAKRPAATKDEP